MRNGAKVHIFRQGRVGAGAFEQGELGASGFVSGITQRVQ
jgi:hypothetical protein